MQRVVYRRSCETSVGCERLSRRDIVRQPRVAAQRLPWVRCGVMRLPRRGCVTATRPYATHSGVSAADEISPRVAAARQPWAVLRKPFGLARKSQLVTCHCGNGRQSSSNIENSSSVSKLTGTNHFFGPDVFCHTEPSPTLSRRQVGPTGKVCQSERRQKADDDILNRVRFCHRSIFPGGETVRRRPTRSPGLLLFLVCGYLV